jgi:hypothetical protein
MSYTVRLAMHVGVKLKEKRKRIAAPWFEGSENTAWNSGMPRNPRSKTQ